MFLATKIHFNVLFFTWINIKINEARVGRPSLNIFTFHTLRKFEQYQSTKLDLSC
jgi:hypothetical protein